MTLPFKVRVLAINAMSYEDEVKRDEMRTWCYTRTGTRSGCEEWEYQPLDITGFRTFYFANETVAVEFKLRFG